MITGIIGSVGLPGLRLDQKTNRESYEIQQTQSEIQSKQESLSQLEIQRPVDSIKKSEESRTNRLLDVKA